MPNVLRSDEKLKYPMQKPVSILRQMIEASTKEGDLVVDPFMGTGSTGVACVQLGRRFIGCEMNAKKFAVAESRIKSAVFMPSLITPSNNRLQPTAFGVGTQAQFPLLGGTQAEESSAKHGGG
jgi:predicted RNA methylase